MFKIAVDLGYGYVKGVNENGDKFLCRTAVGTGSERGISKVFGSSKNSQEHVVICQNEIEREYYIGDLARKQSRDCSSPFDKNKIDHPATKVLLAAAVANLSKNNTKPIHLVTGPPLLYAAKQKESFQNALEDYSAAIQVGVNGSVQYINFDRVTVFPQGAAVVYYLLTLHKELAKKGDIFIIVEPGHKTTEILPFEIGEKIEPMDGYANTLETGAYSIEEAIERNFYDKTGAKLTSMMLDRVMNGEQSIIYNGKEINLSEEKRLAKEELARNIIDGVNHAAGELIGFAKKVVFAGGLAKDPMMVEKFKSIGDNAMIIEDSQFANAHGLLEVAKIIDAKEDMAKR